MIEHEELKQINYGIQLSNLFNCFFYDGAGGAREYVVLVRWKNPRVYST